MPQSLKGNPLPTSAPKAAHSTYTKKTGVAAVKEAGLYDDFLKLARFDGEALIACDKNLTKYLSIGGKKEGDKTAKPEIDRHELRQLLTESLPEGTIRWGCRLRAVDNEGKLHFENNSVESGFDLIVGADGAWSKVRNTLSDQKPSYSGVAGHWFGIPDAKDRAPALYKLLNRGSIYSWSDGRSIMAQQIGDGSISVSTWIVRGEDWMKDSDYDILDLDAAKKANKEEYSDWVSELSDFTQVGVEEVRARSLYMLPIGFQWKNKASVTLLGDAAHVMVPFGGAGVNLALEDSLKLSHAIVDAAKEDGKVETLRTKVAEYEEDMFKRAKPLQELSYGAMRDMFFTEGAPRTTIESWMLRFFRLQMHPLKYYPFAAAIYIFYFFFRLFK